MDKRIGLVCALLLRASDSTPPEALLPESAHLTRVTLVLREVSHSSMIMEVVAVVQPPYASGREGKTSQVVSGEDLTRVMDLVVGPMHESGFFRRTARLETQ